MSSETGPFYKTSEFWAIVAANVGAVLAASVDIMPKEWLPLVMAGSSALYAIARGLAKAGVSPDLKPTVTVAAHPSQEVQVTAKVDGPQPEKPNVIISGSSMQK